MAKIYFIVCAVCAALSVAVKDDAVVGAGKGAYNCDPVSAGREWFDGCEVRVWPYEECSAMKAGRAMETLTVEECKSDETLAWLQMRYPTLSKNCEETHDQHSPTGCYVTEQADRCYSNIPKEAQEQQPKTGDARICKPKVDKDKDKDKDKATSEKQSGQNVLKDTDTKAREKQSGASVYRVGPIVTLLVTFSALSV